MVAMTAWGMFLLSAMVADGAVGALLGVLLLVLMGCDLIELGGALRAVRRMERGQPPARRGVDYGIGPDVWWTRVPADKPYRAQDRVELAAVGSPRLAAKLLARNVALVFALMLVAGVAGACTFATRRHCHGSIEYTMMGANSIRSATILYLNDHPGSCPSVATLKAEGLLERGFSEKDSWGGAWDVPCIADDVVVRSDGPDRRVGTADDIVVPPAEHPDAAR